MKDIFSFYSSYAGILNLTLFSILFSVLFSVLGWLCPCDEFWRLTDLVYTALLLFGLILVFTYERPIRDQIRLIQVREGIQAKKQEVDRDIRSDGWSRIELRRAFDGLQTRIRLELKYSCDSIDTRKKCQKFKSITRRFYRIIPDKTGINNALSTPFSQLCLYFQMAVDRYDRDVHLLLGKHRRYSKARLIKLNSSCKNHLKKEALSKQEGDLDKSINESGGSLKDFSSEELSWKYFFWAYVLPFAISLKFGKWFSDWRNKKSIRKAFS